MDTERLAAEVTAHIRDIPDFPKPGILFKDITPLLANPPLFGRVLDWMATDWGPVDLVVAIESRGFVFGAGLVERMNAGLVLARKAGKLPWATVAVDYGLEYGAASLEMHTDAIRPGQKVLIVDDLLATGGTAAAAVDLVRRLGGEVVGFGFVLELGFLDGRTRLDVPVRSLVSYG
ncbi:MAG: adenine phosphoribosyltransferase [Deltaproteobacteria bacterium]|nr:adenine phosphoribosyltransferase [Deltaproteobacteria bacterium]